MASRKSRRRRKNRNAAYLAVALITLIIAVSALIVITMKQDTPTITAQPDVYTQSVRNTQTEEAEPEPDLPEETLTEPEDAEEEPVIEEEPAEEETVLAEEPAEEEVPAEEEPAAVQEEAVTPEPAPEPTPEPVPEPTPQPTPEPTQEPTPDPTPTQKPTPQPTVAAVKYPYKIVVNKGAQIVGIFTIDENGEYKIPVKYMICSTGKTDKLKNGNYKLKGSDNRYEWRQMFSGVWVHYATRISGNFLFHSLSYNKNKSNTLIADTYKALGTKASDGCVRLMVKDAKWIYDNCPAGTRVQVITGHEEPEIMASIVVPELVSGKWDPTDPNPKNPDYYDEPDATPEPTRYPYATPVPNDFKWSSELRSGRQK